MTSLATVPTSVYPECAQKPENAAKRNVEIFSFAAVFFAAAVLALVGAFGSTPFAVIAGGLLTVATSIAFTVHTILRSAECN
ncbi:MAG: hypothetical protein Q4D87_04300 [Actinomycetaceae bacterium]|nr:hypothetical protein [Actinomycetaceae bacterium]